MKKLIDLSKYPIPKPIQTSFEKVSGISGLNKIYNNIQSDSRDDFFTSCLDQLNLVSPYSQDNIDNIPSSGSLVVVANHPFGAIDGIVLAHFIRHVRSDVKILANYILSGIDELKEHVIEVDPFQNSQSQSAIGIKKAIDWIKAGHVLITFPAGEVSHLKLKAKEIKDSEWSPHIGAIIKHSKANVLPVYFHGRNSNLFQIAGLIHPLMRTLMLPREVLKKQKQVVDFNVGNVLSWGQLKNLKTSKKITRYLRLTTDFLKKSSSSQFLENEDNVSLENDMQPLAQEQSRDRLIREIEDLDSSQILAIKGSTVVYIAKAYQIPRILLEIGRLREKTFREVKEGTGLSRDIDSFDSYYLHLFTWNTDKKEIIGSYRLGLTHKILKKYGKKGLYTNTLFKLGSKLLKELEDSVELGRSFVRKEYQRHPDSLMMLWRGLSKFLAENPRYRFLFGPVSISQSYEKESKDLMVKYLRSQRFDNNLSKSVKARNPYLTNKSDNNIIHDFKNELFDVDDLSSLISHIEKDNKKLPVLLKQYLKLNARLLGFNVDECFSNALDGLIIVDTLNIEPRFFKRLMGNVEYDKYIAHQLLNSIDLIDTTKTSDKLEGS